MKYSLGLDIGTTSVGWAVINLEKNRIEDLGVRIFEKPEVPKTGASLAEPRREARSTRRRLRRRRQRLNFLKDFFVEKNLLTREQVNELVDPNSKARNGLDPYELRSKAVVDELTPIELFIVLHHIAKRRGYKSNRKALEEADKASDSSKVLKAISGNKQLLTEYPTIGKALFQDEKFADRKRNRGDDYRTSFMRADFEKEMRQILEKQAEFYPVLNENSIEYLLFENNKGLFYQRPFMTKELINKMRGKCELESTEKRAPRASYSFELFRLAQELVHLKYILVDENGRSEIHALTPEQIEACVEKAKTVKEFKYSHVREALGYKNNFNFQFTYIKGKDSAKSNKVDTSELSEEDAKKIVHESIKENEKNVLARMNFYYAVRKALSELPEQWSQIESEAGLLDEIGEVMTCNKTDENIIDALSGLGLDRQVVDILVASKELSSLSSFGHLSFRALRKITPYLLQGQTYDKAVVFAGYEFGERRFGDKAKLPGLNETNINQITSPVARRSISQTVKVINAVIHKYGAPYRIGIECAGDLSKSSEERRKILKLQNDNAKLNEEIKQELTNDYHIANPTGLQILKMKFYREQNGICVYTGEQIDLDRLFSDESYCQIDHVIPWSRCGNDTRSNKVLVLNKANQEKGNKTPYETWGADSDRWLRFESRVINNPNFSKAKKNRLLAITPPDESWRLRAINDTRMVTRFISQHVKSNLKFASFDGDAPAQRVVLPNGMITQFLRKLWHLPRKDRNEDNLHHAVDAVITALVTQGIIADCAKYNAFRRYRTKLTVNGEESSGGSMRFAKALDEITNKPTGEIDQEAMKSLEESFLPWSQFDKEVRLRVSQPKEADMVSIWRDQFRDLYRNQEQEFYQRIRPIFVSRMPKRGGKGKANAETVYSPKTLDNDGRTRAVRRPLMYINLQRLEKSALSQTDPLYIELKKRLEDSGNDPKKAFAEPVYKGDVKVDKNGKPISPVKSIKVYDIAPNESGVMISNGKAFVSNGDMIRIDIYRRLNKKGVYENFVVPIYAHQIKGGRYRNQPESLRILPKPKGDVPEYVDSSFEKVCSLHKNDYVVLKYDSGKIIEGYYAGYDISVATATLCPHQSSGSDQNIRPTVRKASVEVRDISVLGDNYEWR